MNAATSERQELTLTVDTQTTTTVVQHNDLTAANDNLRPAPAGELTTEHGDFAHQVRPRTSWLGRHVDGALVIALLAPPALIALLMALGLQFALAVCVTFAVVFIIATSQDAVWIWRRHKDRDDQWNLDWSLPVRSANFRLAAAPADHLCSASGVLSPVRQRQAAGDRDVTSAQQLQLPERNTMEPTTHLPTEAVLDPATTAPVTMRAIVQDRYGSSDTWQLADIDRPEIKPDEVLVHVHAAGLDRGTWHAMTGRPYLMRVMGFGLRSPKNRVPGLAVAGTVAAVGASVTRFTVGDEIFGVSRGAFADYAAAREDKLAHKPSTLTFEQAAAVPISATTALQGLRLGRIEAGQKVLIIGASGGVGSYAVQLAKAYGAEVTGVCSAAKVDLVRSLGTDHTIDYATDDATDGSHRYDLILDIAGNTSLRRLRRALNPTGSLVIVGGESKGNLTGGFGRSLRAPLLSIFVRPRLTMLVSKEHHADLVPLTDLIDAGRLRPSIDATYTLNQARDAMRQLEAGTVRGKISIAMPSPLPELAVDQ